MNGRSHIEVTCNLDKYISKRYRVSFKVSSKCKKEHQTYLTFSIALLLLIFFFVDPESNNKYDSFSNLDKVIISLGIRDRPEKGLPRWLSGRESICQYRDTRDTGLIPGLEKIPGAGNATHSSILAW